MTRYSGLVVGMLFGMLAGSILAVLGVTFGVNQIVTGIAINIFVLGITAFLSRIVFGAQANTLKLPGFKAFDFPGLSSIPIIGPVLFGQDLMVHLMFACVGRGVLSSSTGRLGDWPCARSERTRPRPTAPVCRCPGCATVASSPPVRIAALGGCYLVLAQVFLFSEHMSAGKGFIALAAVILGTMEPGRGHVRLPAVRLLRCASIAGFSSTIRKCRTSFS